MSTVIQVSNLSKIYRLGEIGTGTITRDLERWYKMKIRGQEDPFLKIGETNVRSEKGVSDVVYALRDINFEVKQGEALGIIGKNGAGKSTLLKILSRVTSPTTGKINIKGRVASLLEVGTGFHPELTGRENIYLNGAILGMRKKEITRKLDEIIDFSGVERYIDTPVKRYSSGMYVRLAFAVAAHMESEILIVDEVLAVGDAEFQKKCLGKMGEMSRGEGRTVLFVSHNMGAILNLCRKVMVLKNGAISFEGGTIEGVNNYLSYEDNSEVRLKGRKDRVGNNLIKFIDYKILNTEMKIIEHILCGQTIDIKLYYECDHPEYFSYGILVGITLKNQLDIPIALHHSRLNELVIRDISNLGYFNLRINEICLAPTIYNVGISIMDINGSEFIDSIDNAFQLDIQNGTFPNMKEIPPSTHGNTLLNAIWNHSKINII